MYIEQVRVIFDKSLVVQGPPLKVKRSVWERLFSLPWKPFEKEKNVVRYLPSDKGLWEDEVTLRIHPYHAKKAFSIIKERKKPCLISR